MKTQVVISSIIALMLLGCSQPDIECHTGHGAFAAKYTLIEGNGPCAELEGGVLGVSTYWQAGQVDARGRAIAPDLSTPSVAIQPEELGLLNYDAAFPDETEGHKTYAIGDFAEHLPGEDNLCHAPALEPARQDLTLLVEQAQPEPEEPLEEGEAPPEPVFDEVPTSVAYSFSNATFYVTPEVPGTQMTSNLVYEKDGCSATYDVQAIFPAVFCGAPDPEDETGETLIPDVTLCASTADPDNGRPVGSGINPDFAVGCDPEILYCVATGPMPSLKSVSN